MGKTALVTRFCSDIHREPEITDIVDFKVKKVEIDSERVRLHLWDTAGQERFKSMSFKLFRGANGVVVVYDVTDRDSFLSVNQWMESIRKYCHSDINMVLVGNKCDMGPQRQVEFHEGEELAQELNAVFFETSARRNYNVTEAFHALVKNVMQVKHPSFTPTLREDEKEEVKKLLCNCCS